MTTVDWKKKYYELLEKHNDYIDELMLATSLDSPSIIVFIKFYGPWVKTSTEAFKNILLTKINLPPSRLKFIYATIGADTKHDVTIDMYPIRKFLTGEIDCDMERLHDLLDAEKVEFVKSQIPF